MVEGEQSSRMKSKMEGRVMCLITDRVSGSLLYKTCFVALEIIKTSLEAFTACSRAPGAQYSIIYRCT